MTHQALGVYDNPVFNDNVYGHTLELLRSHLNEISGDVIHLDIGCGFARIAEPIMEGFGLHYVGLDASEDRLEFCRGRGLEVQSAHLRGEQETYDLLKKIIGKRKVAAITMLDVLEHLPDGDDILRAIRRIALEHAAFIVISVPNVSHVDVGLKLLFGKWDLTEEGLLDHTHVRMFTRESLNRTLRSCGLYPIKSYDVRKKNTEQHFPADHPALAFGSMLHRFLYNLRDYADSDGNVFQFVQICLAGALSCKHSYLDRDELYRPFLSIVTRTQGFRIHTLREIITALAAQSKRDFELLIVGHNLSLDRQYLIERAADDAPAWLRNRIRIIKVDDGNRTRPLNLGFENALGHYISILDDDDLPMANWVEEFMELASRSPGSLLRTSVVRQDVESVTIEGNLGLRAIGPLEMSYPSCFDFFEHLNENKTPPVALAFPRGVFHELNIKFDEDLTTTEDWDYILRAAALVGVTSSEKITAIYRWWVSGTCSRTDHDNQEWFRNRLRILDKIDHNILLLPEGSSQRIRTLLQENQALNSMVQSQDNVYQDNSSTQAQESGARVEALARILTILSSRSWKVTAPMRFLASCLGRPKVVFGRIPFLTDAELEKLHHALIESTSWRMTAPLRRLGAYFRQII